MPMIPEAVASMLACARIKIREMVQSQVVALWPGVY